MSVRELNLGNQLLTSHQRIKDREMQRAHDKGLDVPFLPTKTRAKRAGTTQTKLIKEYQHAHSLPVQDSPLST